MSMRNMDDLIRRQNRDHSIWNKFKSELIYKNRFFPDDGEFLERLDKIILALVNDIEKDSIWFRAREFVPYDPEALGKKVLTEEDKFKFLSEGYIYNFVPGCIDAYSRQKLLDMLSVYADVVAEKDKTSIWGYSKEESGMPPRDKSGISRASPKYIPYLYLANDNTTALAEARALPKQKYSVAKYRIMKKLNIVDFSMAFNADKLPKDDLFLASFAFNAFSRPSHSNEKDYFVAQFITEYIKTFDFDGLIFDGIAFSSSRNEDGVNLTLFDDSACEFLGSSIHEVTEIKVSSRQLLPLLPDEKLYGRFSLEEE